MMPADDEDELRPFASPPCFMHELSGAYADVACPAGGPGHRRLLPERPLPPYAYLPGRFPHPVRHPQGHSHHLAGRFPAAEEVDPDGLLWGMELFNHKYYWEAHEAWEGLWRAAARGSAEHALLQGLILLAAMGVKLREGKRGAARRHGTRAVVFFGHSAAHPAVELERLLGHSAARLALLVGEIVTQSDTDASKPVSFDFMLGCRTIWRPGQ